MTPVRSRAKLCLATFLVSASTFALLRSEHWIGDGLRYVPAAFAEAAPFGTPNHFLFPPWAWSLRAILHGLGALPVDPQLAHIQFIRSMQVSNAVFAGVVLSTLVLFLLQLGVRRTIAVSVIIMVGLSQAFALHATDMTEPMPSLAFSMLSLTVALGRGRFWPGRVTAGLLLGVAAAFYLAAAGAALVAALLVAGRSQGVRSALVSASTFVAAFCMSFLAIGLLGNVAIGGHGLAESLRLSVTLPTAGGLFGGFLPRHLVGAAFGHANAWAPLVDYRGASALLRQPAHELGYNLLALTVAWSSIGILAWRARGAPLSLPLAGAISWWSATFLLAAYWSATYEKLWLYGVIGLSIACAWVLEHHRTPLRHHWAREPLVSCAAVLAISSVALGIVPRRFSSSDDLALAKKVTARIGPADLLVAPGWDGPSVVATTVLDFSLNRFSLVDEAIRHSLDSELLRVELEHRAAGSLRKGGKVCFLGLVALSEDAWAPFFGTKLGLPYGFLDAWKSRVRSSEILVAGASDASVELACVEGTP